VNVPMLSKVDLSQNPIGNVALQGILLELNKSPRLLNLNISSVEAEDSIVLDLCKLSMKNTNLSEINLSKNRLTDAVPFHVLRS
jgi:hypothetical protein